MKKILVLVLSLVFGLMNLLTCYAGDIPEGLLGDENTLVFYGEVKEISENSITVVVSENIKGVAMIGDAYSYDEWIFTENPVVGEIYLCGYYDENNPLSIWEIERKEDGKIDIIKSDNMCDRMENYINDGDFAKAQADLLASEEDGEDIAIIGSADGPTNIYVSSTGEVSRIMILGVAAVAFVIAVMVAVIVIIRANKRNKAEK